MAAAQIKLTRNKFSKLVYPACFMPELEYVGIFDLFVMYILETFSTFETFDMFAGVETFGKFARACAGVGA